MAPLNTPSAEHTWGSESKAGRGRYEKRTRGFLQEEALEVRREPDPPARGICFQNKMSCAQVQVSAGLDHGDS